MKLAEKAPDVLLQRTKLRRELVVMYSQGNLVLSARSPHVEYILHSIMKACAEQLETGFKVSTMLL